MSNQIRQIVLLALCGLLASACSAAGLGISNDSSIHVEDTVDWQAMAESLQKEEERDDGHGKIQLVSALATPTPTLSVDPAPAPLVGEQAKVAYVQDGDIWVKALSDGKPQRLTDDGSNQSPQWSASGLWISFVKNPDAPELWITQSDGDGAQQIAIGVAQNSYAWSPLEDNLALAKGAELSFYALNKGAKPSLDSTVKVGTPESGATIDKITWSPNGQQLAFTYSVPQSGDNAPNALAKQDGLWLVDIASGALKEVVESGVPAKGQIILKGWSSDGVNLLYWQGPVLSASLLADGVPFYQVAANGGTPQAMADAVVVHDDVVQSQPNGLSQVAFVVGSGREMWDNKSLQSVSIDGGQALTLTTAGQVAASPAWSPSGDAIAYAGMPAAENVGGGANALAALDKRQIWVVDAGTGDAHSVEMSNAVREEAPQWINDETLLVARIDGKGNVSLWQINRTGNQEQKVVDEISPAPDGFGYYGYIDWRPYFSLWRPQSTAGSVPSLADILEGLQGELTQEAAVALWGKPDAVTGSGLLIYQYQLDDGVSLWLGFPGDGPLVYAQLHTPSGKIFELKPVTSDQSGTEAPATSTPTA